MSILQRLSSLWSWSGPRETQQRRDKPFKTQLKPLPRKTQTKRSSPEPESADEQDTALDPPQTPTSNRLDLDSLGGSPDYNATDNTKVERDTEAELKGEYVLDVEAQEAKVKAELQNLRDHGWPEEIMNVYYRISMRGFQALLPKEYAADFPGYPAGLFTEREKAYIVPVGQSDFRAVQAFKALSHLGPDFRDAVRTQSAGTPNRRRPADYVKNAVQAYHKWACADAKFDVGKGGADIPLLVFEANPPGGPTVELERRLKNKLEALAARWNALLRIPSDSSSSTEAAQAQAQSSTVATAAAAAASAKELSLSPPTEISTSEYIFEPPCLYGIVTSGATCGLVYYNLRNPGPVVPIAVLNFTQPRYDFWNAFAVAIFVVHVRDVMFDVRIDLKEAFGGEGGEGEGMVGEKEG